MISKNNFNLLIAICASLMLISYFLPWFEIRSSVGVMGYSSSYRHIKSGADIGSYSIFIPLISIACLVMAITNKRLMFIPGLINLVVAALFVTGLQQNSVDVSYQFGDGRLGAAYGIYLFLFSSIGYVLFTLMLMFSPSTASSPIEPAIDTVSTPANVQFKSSIDLKFLATLLKKYRKAILVIIGVGVICFLAFIGIIYYSDYMEQKRRSAISSEEFRLDEKIKLIEKEIENNLLTRALSDVGMIKWSLDTTSEYYNHYESISLDLQSEIAKKEAELANAQAAKADSIDRAKEIAIRDSLRRLNVSDITIPYNAKALRMTNMYIKPDWNSDKQNGVSMDDFVAILNDEVDFSYCRYDVGEGQSLYGWIPKQDLIRW